MKDWHQITIYPSGKVFLANITADTSEQLDAECLWSEMPDALRLVLAQTAPQVIPPWAPYSLSEGDDRECRADRAGFYAWNARNQGIQHAGCTFCTPGWYRYGNSSGGAVGEKPTREEARAAADALVLAEGNRVLA